MATLLNAVTEDTIGTGVEFTLPTTVYQKGNIAPGQVLLEISPDGNVNNYYKVCYLSDEPINVNPEHKPYFLRASRTDSAGGSVTVIAEEPEE